MLRNQIAILLLVTAAPIGLSAQTREMRVIPATSNSSWQSRHFSGNRSGLGSTDLLPPPDNSRVVQAQGTEISGPNGFDRSNGQVWREYNISRYTQRHAAEEKPEQTIVDWILRETGTELWFSEPLGVLSANRQTLRVYHTPEIQRTVATLVDRFVRPDTEQNIFGIRMLTVSNPNWRTKATPRMTSVPVQSPGVEAWLMSHEDAAIVLDDLHKRTDCRDYNSPNLLIQNGDTHSIIRTRPVAYVRGVEPFRNGLGGHQMQMGQVEEGFQLKLSPLVSSDRIHVDAVIKVDSHQVERFKSVSIPTPTAQNPRQMSMIKVPQTSSWRLHERFHWPANQVLLVSCGVVSSPGPEKQVGTQLPNLNLIPRPPRSDALIFIDAKGRATDLGESPQRQAQLGDLNYRGRY